MDLHHPTFELPLQGQSPDTTFIDPAMPSCGAYKYQVTFIYLFIYSFFQVTFKRLIFISRFYSPEH